MDKVVGWLIATFANGATAAVVIVGLAYVLKDTIAAYAQKRIEAGFAGRLAKIESGLRTEETRLSDLQKHSLSKIGRDNEVLVAKRADAISALWACHCEAQTLAYYAETLKVLNFEGISKRISDPKIREFAATVGAGLTMARVTEVGKVAAGTMHRPFVSEDLWSVHSAYNAVVFYAASVFVMWAEGINPIDALDHNKISETVWRALPEHRSYLDDRKMQAALNLIDVLDAKLVNGIRKFVTGEDTDLEAAERASKAVAYAAKLRASPEQEAAVKGLAEAT